MRPSLPERIEFEPGENDVYECFPYEQSTAQEKHLLDDLRYFFDTNLIKIRHIEHELQLGDLIAVDTVRRGPAHPAQNSIAELEGRSLMLRGVFCENVAAILRDGEFPSRSAGLKTDNAPEGLLAEAIPAVPTGHG